MNTNKQRIKTPDISTPSKNTNYDYTSTPNTKNNRSQANISLQKHQIPTSIKSTKIDLYCISIPSLTHGNNKHNKKI